MSVKEYQAVIGSAATESTHVPTSFPPFASSDKLSRRALVVLIAAAWLVGVAARLVWPVYASGIEAYTWQGRPTPQTADPYYFGAILQNALDGRHSHNAQVPSLLREGAITAGPALLARLTGVAIEDLILYLPVVVAPLLCVPVLLLAHAYGSNWWGFLASLVAVLAPGYYSRTMAGYFDTDMLSVTWAMAALCFLLLAAKERRLSWAGLAALTLCLYPFFYRPGAAIGYALGFAYVAYVALTRPRDPFTWQSTALVAAGLSISKWAAGLRLMRDPVPFLVGITLLALLYLVARRLHGLVAGLLVSLGCVAVLLFATRPLDLFLRRVAPLVRPPVIQAAPEPAARAASPGEAGDDGGEPREGRRDRGPKFARTLATVEEAEIISWDRIAFRVVGSNTGALIVIAGVAALCLAGSEWLLTLPLAGLAVFAAFAGGRFSIYAVPVAALAAVYALYRLAAFGGARRRWLDAAVTGATVLLLLPSLAYIASSRPPVLLDRDAIAALDQLHQRATPDDVVVTWWDYGAAVWFFSGCPTLNSAANNYSDDTYLISRILATPSPVESARLARETVETFARGNGKESAVEEMLETRPPGTAPEESFDAIASGERPLAAKTREAFLYLPIGLLTRFPAIRSFSARDLTTGKPEPAPDFRTIGSYEWRGQTLIIDDVVAIDLLRASVEAVDGGEPALHLRALHLVEGADQGGQTVSRLELEPDASLHLVLMPDQRLGFVMDGAMLDSLLVQMLAFEHWDPALFEPIVLNPRAKVYRVRI